MQATAHVQSQLSDLTRDWWRGYDEGYYAPPGPLPSFYSKAYSLFTAYERGYVFGREMKAHERDRLP